MAWKEERAVFRKEMRAMEKEIIKLTARLDLVFDERNRLLKEKGELAKDVQGAFENGFCRGFAVGSGNRRD
eukprot:7188588-Prymnesium_polylepis.1